MGSYHTVKQGEHVSRIAADYGFANYGTLWDHPENAALKRARRNPNVIFPGDTVFVPDLDIRTLERDTDHRHRFRLFERPLSLRLVLDNSYGEPLEHASCTLLVETVTTELTTDEFGRVETDIPKRAEKALLRVSETLRTSRTEATIYREFDIEIGHLDPVEEVSGQLARLSNLGYYSGCDDSVDEVEFRSAVEEFQCEHALVVDGKCGPKTQARLKEIHGC
jgi:putative peptidoglycan binding protein